jgi:hypothetical protein
MITPEGGNRVEIDFTKTLKFDSPSIKSALYKGPVFAMNPTISGFPPDPASDRNTLNRLGSTAISRCKPTNSVADAATFLGELRKDGIPHLPGVQTWKDRTDLARKAGSEYLNVQFGYMPLIRDMRSIAHSVRHANTVLEQYERDAGRTVRRRINLPSEVSTHETDINDSAHPFVDPYNSRLDQMIGTGKLKFRVETRKDRWFSGAFTYHLPAGKDYRSKMIRYALEADKLFGVLPDPETLWNLAPWSWAVDWFSNTGDVLSNLSDWAIDGLVMRYGYMMERSISKYTYILEDTSGVTLLNTGEVIPGISVPDVTFVTETKKRIRANPFGFGVSWDGLSPFQTSIAAALGISRR